MTVESGQLKKIYENVFLSVKFAPATLIVKVEFYPFVGISSRIRLRDGRLHVRISDLLRGAPVEVHKALAAILIKKLFKKKASPADEKIYRDFVGRAQILEKAVENRRRLGRKILSSPEGTAYDLEKIFALLNDVYFQNSLPKPTLTWSAKKTYRILGHHDSAHRTIVISRSLDDPRVPLYVVEYVVYHEMLHIKHPTEHRNGRRFNHTPAFRRDEENFARFKEAENWIEENATALKRKARRK